MSASSGGAAAGGGTGAGGDNTGTNPSPGRSGGGFYRNFNNRQGRGGRGFNRGGRNPATGEGHQASQGQAKFKGLTDLAGNIFDLPSESKADQFVTTTKALANHVGTIYRKNTAAFRTAVTDLVLTPPTRPADIEAGATHMEAKIWEIAYKRYSEDTIAYGDFQANLFSLVLGQCTEGLQDKLKSHTDYETTEAAQDGVELLKIVKELTYSFETNQKNRAQALCEMTKKLYHFHQGKNMTLQQYHEQFINLTD